MRLQIKKICSRYKEFFIPQFSPPTTTKKYFYLFLYFFLFWGSFQWTYAQDIIFPKSSKKAFKINFKVDTH